jgi:hypothetical protein
MDFTNQNQNELAYNLFGDSLSIKLSTLLKARDIKKQKKLYQTNAKYFLGMNFL